MTMSVFSLVTGRVCRYKEYITTQASWFYAKRYGYCGNLDTVMNYLTVQFNGYRWHPDQTEKESVYNPWSITAFLLQSASTSTQTWSKTAPESTVLASVGLNAAVIMATFEYSWRTLCSSISVRDVPREWQKV